MVVVARSDKPLFWQHLVNVGGSVLVVIAVLRVRETTTFVSIPGVAAVLVLVYHFEAVRATLVPLPCAAGRIESAVLSVKAF